VSDGGNDAASFVYLIGCLVLVASALTVRRMPISNTLKMAGGWLLIFAVAFVGFTLKDDFLALGRRVVSDAGDGGQAVTAGGELRIRKSLDGHFWVNAKLNGREVRLLIDSGATVTSISSETAKRVNVVPSSGFPVAVETANGVVAAARGRIDRLEVGTIERRDVAVLVADEFGSADVLGMNFLSSLSGWKAEGEWLIFRP
jgi:aspartyl protease family protein